MRSFPKRLASILLMVVLLAAGCSSDGSAPGSGPPKQGKPVEPEIPKADFNLLNLKAIDPQDRPDAGAKAEEKRAQILEMFNSLYNEAFLDPAKWEGGAHPGVSGFFTQEAQGGLTANLGSLALGDIVPGITAVTPDKQEITRLTLYVGDDFSVPLGVASIVFDATATPVGKGATPVIIRQTAEFWLQKDGDGYKIAAYRADINANSQPGSGG